jgi:hypothetical protein
MKNYNKISYQIYHHINTDEKSVGMMTRFNNELRQSNADVKKGFFEAFFTLASSKP